MYEGHSKRIVYIKSASSIGRGADYENQLCEFGFDCRQELFYLV